MGSGGHTVLEYKDALPNDIKPLVALDASARVRHVYECWDKGRGGLIRLPWAQKRYENLAIHVWKRAGGKSGFRRHGQELVQGVVSTVMTRPNEPWLIVYHKTGIDMDFEDEVRARLPMFPPDVHFCHWGAHDATNAFAHVPNVILAGTLFMRTSCYEALGRLAAAYPSSRGPFGKQQEKLAIPTWCTAPAAYSRQGSHDDIAECAHSAMAKGCRHRCLRVTPDGQRCRPLS